MPHNPGPGPFGGAEVPGGANQVCAPFSFGPHASRVVLISSVVPEVLLIEATIEAGQGAASPSAGDSRRYNGGSVQRRREEGRSEVQNVVVAQASLPMRGQKIPEITGRDACATNPN